MLEELGFWKSVKVLTMCLSTRTCDPKLECSSLAFLLPLLNLSVLKSRAVLTIFDEFEKFSESLQLFLREGTRTVVLPATLPPPSSPRPLEYCLRKSSSYPPFFSSEEGRGQEMSAGLLYFCALILDFVIHMTEQC